MKLKNIPDHSKGNDAFNHQAGILIDDILFPKPEADYVFE